MPVPTAPLRLMPDKRPAEGPRTWSFPPAHGNTPAQRTSSALRARFPVFQRLIPEVTS